MSGCFPTGPRYLKSTNWLQDSFIIQKCHILWTITSFHFYGDIGRKIQKQKVLEWRENGGACAAGGRNCLPDANRQRPALTCVLLPSIHFTNRLLTKLNRKSSCGWSFAQWTRYQQRWEVWANIISSTDMFPSIPALPGCGAWGIGSYDTKKKQGIPSMTIHFVLFW